VTAGPALDTRSRILGAASELFLQQGYIETSIRQIAKAVGLTKTAVLYHFPTKDAILTELAEPMLAAMEQVLHRASAQPAEQARWTVINGVLDASFTHLRILAIANAAWVMRDPIHRRVLDINTQAMQIIAGPGGGLRESVRASAALALLARPTVFHRDAAPEDVRREVMLAVARLFEDDGPHTPPPRTTVDRRRVLDATKLAELDRLRETGRYSATELATALGVSRATLYRYLRRYKNL
jgi:AcrR family transcriptional regulator